MAKKRKFNAPHDEDEHPKKVKIANEDVTAAGVVVVSPADSVETDEISVNEVQSENRVDNKGKGKEAATDGVEMEESIGKETKNTAPRKRIRKLAPARPFPTVPTSVSATGPRSAHTEGKNRICITRKTNLGAYLRRCKDLVLKDGYKTLELNAMGAAIPQLLQLVTSLPDILPHDPEEIHTEILTGTVEVQDEVIPDDEDEDISYQTRSKSTLKVNIKIGDGIDEVLRSGKGKNSARSGGRKHKVAKPQVHTQPKQIIREEDVMDDGS